MIYVLIILWFPNTSQSGKAVATQEFFSQAKCEKAAVAVLRSQGEGSLLRTLCVEK